VVIGALLLAVPFFFLNANLRSPEKTNALDRAVIQLSGPIQYLATQAAESVSSVVQEYVYLVDVKKDNTRLQEENGRFRERIHALEAAADENVKLRELLSLDQHLGGENLAAHVIGKDFSPFFRVTRIRLDRGDHDLVKPGMPVVASGGLVGRIRRTEGRYSDVLLTVDLGSAVDVRVRRTGARGMLRGTGESDRYLCRIQYLDRNDEVKVGDEVHTTGFGKDFPQSILVGRVSKVVRKEFGLHQEVEVVPSVNFGKIDEVLILTAGPRAAAAAASDGSP